MLLFHNDLMSNILQDIFKDQFEEIKYPLHPRGTEMENIDKMINCSDPAFHCVMYSCPHCGKVRFVPFHCHSHFCPTFGNKYSMGRTTSMSFKPVQLQHSHCVFTIENLPDFFQKFSLLNCLSHAVNREISRMFL